MKSLSAALLFLVAWTGVAAAQSPVSIELRAGGVIPTGELGGADLSAGPGLEASVSYRLMPHLRLYAGWGWRHFTTDTPLAGGDYDVENTGYMSGLLFQHPLRGSLWGWVRGGPVYEHIELEQGADIAVDSGHEAGWELGGGLRVPLTDRLAVLPGVRYRSLSADLELNGAQVPVDLRYIAVDVGVAWSFGSLDAVGVAIR